MDAQVSMLEKLFVIALTSCERKDDREERNDALQQHLSPLCHS